MAAEGFCKSPMNYIGNKYRIMQQIKRWFPKDINTFVDLFCGGCDVTINTSAKTKYANDINYHVIEIFKMMQQHSADYILGYIDGTIDKWQLSKTDADAYHAFRDYCNASGNPLDLYVLMCFSFNYQFRFNSQQQYNNPFGRNRSSFNETMRANLVQMIPRIRDVKFSSEPFQEFDLSVLASGDFLYADPPYLITTGSYNDGKRGFTGWSETEELRLYKLLDELDARGVKFALSNVSKHKGRTNDTLIAWKRERRYHMHNIDFDYSNSSYHGKNTDKTTREVLITNY